ncbi:hypothetical protein C8Q73DRAFT_670873 [Cubamyces lactineus]|nr:hypothetical protein C8Q73DRAFT_670873 [Cubamyces lactineus]
MNYRAFEPDFSLGYPDSQAQEFGFPQTLPGDPCLSAVGYSHTAALSAHSWSSHHNHIYHGPQPELQESFLLEPALHGSGVAVSPNIRYPNLPINTSLPVQDQSALHYQCSLSFYPPGPASSPGFPHVLSPGPAQSMGFMPHSSSPIQPPLPAPSDTSPVFSDAAGIQQPLMEPFPLLMTIHDAQVKEFERRSNSSCISPVGTEGSTSDSTQSPVAVHASFDPTSPTTTNETTNSVSSPAVSRRTRSRAGHAPYPTPSSSSRDTSPGSPVRRARRRRKLPAADTASSPSALGLTSIDDRWKCPYCPYVQKNKRPQELKRHKQTHDEVVHWVCCGIPLDEALQRGDLPAEVLRTPCKYEGLLMVGGCQMLYSRKDALRRHLKASRGVCYGDESRGYLLGNKLGAR